jgi:GTP-binding protein Era
MTTTMNGAIGYRAGFVGLIGQPNAGKSTLLNILIDEKVAIVTPKPQTTRRRVLGLVSRPEGQIVCVDAPGIVRAKSGLNSFLEKEALDVIASSDALIGVLGLDEKNKEQIIEILDLLKNSKKKFLVVITKAELSMQKHRVDIIKTMVREISPTADIFEMSSKWGDDNKEIVKDIVAAALKIVPESKAPLYDVELFTPHSVKDLAAEIIREKCFEQLSQEIPYNLAIRIVKFDESNPKLPKIYADIVTSRDNHKGIVIGKGAQTLKKIGSDARSEIEKMLGMKVFLKLEVVVREDWAQNKSMMKDLGYVVDEN